MGAKSAKAKPNEIRLVRVYDAPVKAVWDAWTDPKQAAKWWGPRGFTITTHSKDLRVGGTWVYTMHGPDGTDYPNIATYHEVEPYAKLVYDHGASEGKPPLFRVTVFFSEHKGKTTMEMTMALETPEAAKATKKFIKEAGGNGTWDRLAEYLAKQDTGKEQFVINRSFDAPIDVVYEMWTNPKHVSQWMPPTGFNMEYIRADIRPGGSAFYVMAGNDIKMYGQAHYIELRQPDRLVYTQNFCDENEKMSRHPLAPTWPAVMLTTVTLTEEADNQTRVTVVWECQGQLTKEELETFISGRAGMTGGWTGSFDKLEGYLAKQS